MAEAKSTLREIDGKQYMQVTGRKVGTALGVPLSH